MGHMGDSDADALLERAAQGADIAELARGRRANDQPAREQAQGTEIFANPDGGIPPVELVDGPPGEEALDGEQAGLGRDNGDERDRAEDEGYAW